MVENPALETLMGAYLNEDVFDEYDDVWSGVDAFLADGPLATSIPNEVDRVLATITSEEEIHRYLARIGIGFRLLPGEGSYRDWLSQLSRRVSAQLDAGTGELG